MRRHAKAPSVGSIDGNGRGLFRCASATRGTFGDSNGSGAPSFRRLRGGLALLALALTTLAATAAGASAAPLAAKMEPISNVSYVSAHVAGKISSPGCVGFCGTTYTFQYSKDPVGEGWTVGLSGFLPGENLTEVSVSGDLQGLKGDTTYFVRLVAVYKGNEAPAPAAPPYPSFTTLHVDPPSVIATDDASGVFSLSAKATGEVDRPANPDPAFDAECNFEYVTDTQFTENTGNSLPGFEGATSVGCNHNPVTAGDGPNVEAELTGLSPSTTYHLRLHVANAAGSDAKEAAHTFTTQAAVEKPSVVSIEEASEISYKTAKVKGVVERPAGADPALETNCRFEFVTDAQFTENTSNSLPGFEGAQVSGCDQSASGPISAAGQTPVTATLDLKSGITYHLRLTAENASGTDTKGAANTFTTIPGGEPSSSINPPEMGYTSVQLSGSVKRGLGEDEATEVAQYAWEYAEVGTEHWNGYGETLALFPEAGLGPMVVSHEFKGLTPNTEYKFRLDLSGSFVDFGQQFGPEVLGTTRPLATPSVTFDPVSGITGTSAHFSGSVDTQAPAGPLDELGKAAYKTEWHFECSPECPPNFTLSGTVEGEEGSNAISADATHLPAHTSFEVKLIAHNAFFSTEETQTFQTPLVVPSVQSTAGASDGKGGYTLQGIVNPNNSNLTDCKFEWGPNSSNYAFSAPCSPDPGASAKPVTVEAHLTGLTPSATYHAKLVATNAAGTNDGGDQTFVPTLNPPEECANEQLRKENNSLSLPECRAYEQVSSNEKGGHPVEVLADFHEDDAVAYMAGGNIANSGSGYLFNGAYTTIRASTGWETIPNLNGPTGSPYTGSDPIFFDTFSIRTRISEDLRSTLWLANPGAEDKYYDGYRPVLRKPDGSFHLIGDQILPFFFHSFEPSADLSHLFIWNAYGPGLHEFVGTGAEQQPGRVDLDNSGNPITPCGKVGTGHPAETELTGSVSPDGSVVTFTTLPCAGGSPVSQLWTRVGGTTFEVSRSQCTRTAGDPGGACNAPADAYFEGGSKDGRRIYFSTTQQLVNGDTDQTKDLYRCDIPSGTPAPSGSANSCSSLSQVSGGGSEARIDRVVSLSADGSTASFLSPAVLASNKDALGEVALPSDHNLYVWRKDAAHPSGETAFVGKLNSDDLGREIDALHGTAQTTPEGRYLVFTTTTPLIETDTDTAADVYRYDTDTGEMLRVSTNVSGVAGNGDGFDAKIQGRLYTDYITNSYQTHTAVSSDGASIVFTTSEALSPLDGNEEPDAYLWKAGKVSLISTGSVGGGATMAAIDESGRDIYFLTNGELTPSDGDDAGDIYDARIGGGFSFAPTPACSGEACQPSAPTPSPAQAPATGQPATSEGNFKPCPKGKVMRKGHCVKKQTKKQKKKHKGKANKAGPNRGGSK